MRSNRCEQVGEGLRLLLINKSFLIREGRHLNSSVNSVTYRDASLVSVPPSSSTCDVFLKVSINGCLGIETFAVAGKLWDHLGVFKD